jgi:hypothetical protein
LSFHRIKVKVEVHYSANSLASRQALPGPIFVRLHRFQAAVASNPFVHSTKLATLAGLIAPSVSNHSTRFDLENPADVARLADPMLALQGLKGIVVLDEVQRRPDLFPVLRVLADRKPVRARFLVLGYHEDSVYITEFSWSLK